MKKWKWLAICVLIIVLAGGAAGTYAFFTTSEIAHNVISSGSVSVEIIEQSQTANGLVDFEDVANALPGKSFSKIVTAQNTGSAEAWVRAKVTTDVTLAVGENGEADVSIVTLDFNTADWTEKDGYYYYNIPLSPGAVTKPLFTTVTLAKGMGDIYQNSSVSVAVDIDAVQKDNNGESAIEAKGWLTRKS